MDRTGADFYNVVDMMKERLGCHPVPIQLPIGAEGDFSGLIDLVDMRARLYPKDDEKKGAEFEDCDIPEDMADKADEYREMMLESLAEYDDAFAERYLEDAEFTKEELHKYIRQATLEAHITPVLCGSAFKNKGVQMLLDAVIDYLPAPTDVDAMKGFEVGNEEKELTRAPSDDEPFSALSFKVMSDPHVGKLTYMRVYSGVVKAGSYVLNSTKDHNERVGRLLLMHANDREQIDEARTGDIVAVVGFKRSTTGDTICDPDKPVLLESMTFPEPVISIAIEPETKADQDKLGVALQKLAEEDPTFRVSSNEETNQTIISGMGELHLEIIVDRLKREFKVNAQVGQPQVAYRETITGEAEIREVFKRQSGGKGQFADVNIKIMPREPGTGFEFSNKIVGGVIPKEFIPAVEKGIVNAMTTGVLAGYPMVDVRVELFDGSFHAVDSSELAFQTAGSIAFKKGSKQASPVLLEPVFECEVVTPEEYMGDIIGSLNQRRAKVKELNERKGNVKVILSTVPLAEMFGYTTVLRSISQGRAQSTLIFSHYEPVPNAIAEELVKKESGE
jgi:elongation factor G